jgi:hypothetical protein
MKYLKSFSYREKCTIAALAQISSLKIDIITLKVETIYCVESLSKYFTKLVVN